MRVVASHVSRFSRRGHRSGLRDLSVTRLERPGRSAHAARAPTSAFLGSTATHWVLLACRSPWRLCSDMYSPFTPSIMHGTAAAVAAAAAVAPCPHSCPNSCPALLELYSSSTRVRLMSSATCSRRSGRILWHGRSTCSRARVAPMPSRKGTVTRGTTLRIWSRAPCSPPVRM